MQSEEETFAMYNSSVPAVPPQIYQWLMHGIIAAIIALSTAAIAVFALILL